MDTEKYINLYFDRFLFQVDYKTLKKFVRNEFERLAKITGYSISGLKIEFRTNTKDDTVACFSYRGSKPEGFCVYLNKLEKTSANKIVDVCRHEFAHYVAFVQNGCKPLSDPHNEAWKKVCNQLEAYPSPYLQMALTKHFKNI